MKNIQPTFPEAGIERRDRLKSGRRGYFWAAQTPMFIVFANSLHLISERAVLVDAAAAWNRVGAQPFDRIDVGFICARRSDLFGDDGFAGKDFGC